MSTNTVTWQEALTTVEKLTVADQLRLISELLLRMQNLTTEGEPLDLLDLAGVGAEVWRDVDVDDYITQERDSWQA
jgi:hypothetical protein